MKVRKLFTLVLTFCLGLLATVGLTSCGSKNPLESLELKKNFENSNFLKDGIQEMTVVSVSDGDTALFRTAKMSFNVRFFGINTPESTWQIEKWGKAASDFTKGKLKDAKSVVIEGSQTPPVTESTGGRYLGFVWYMPKDGNRYYNLNLEVVLNGYSDSSIEPSHEYYKYFEQAQKIAQKEQLAIHGNAKDDKFDETLEKVSLKDICANPASFDQQFVQVECTIKETNGKNVTIADVVDGKEYTFPVYLGYLSLGDDRICRPGNRTQFVGRVSSHDNDWQLTGIERNTNVADTTKVLVEGYEMTFGKGNPNSFYKYDSITVTEVREENGNYIVTGKTNSVRVKNVVVNLVVNKTFVSNITKGNTIICQAYNVDRTVIKPTAETFTVTVTSQNDITVL